MLRTGIEQTQLYQEFAPLLSPLGITIVDVNSTEHGMTSAIALVIKTEDHDVNTQDCAKAYNLLYPRLEMRLGERDLHLEVSTPGLQRNFRDIHEFALFQGRRVRLYESGRDAWIDGMILETNAQGVTLGNVHLEDQKEDLGTQFVPFEQIQKAKLDYRWEDVAHVQ